jgi:aspartate aminotransferase
MTSDRIAALRPTAVNRVLAEVRDYQATGKSVVSLMRGQPDSPTPKHIIAAAEQSLHKGRTGYPDNQGEPALRQAVAAKLLRDQGLSYDPASEILITDGATCGLALALGAILNPGDEVLLPDPIYDAYASPIALFGGRPVPVPSTIEDGRFTIGRSVLEAACSPRTRALLLNDPWNPVGTVFTSDELRAIGDFAVEHNLWLISDEIYESLVYDGRRHISPAAVPAAQPRTVLVNSLSKTYAMTGWRVGYCAAPADLIRAMLLLLQQFSRGPATFVQDAAVCALESSQDCVHQMAAEYQARRGQVVRALGGLPGIRPLIPDGGLFVMADLRDALVGWAPPTTSDVGCVERSATHLPERVAVERVAVFCEAKHGSPPSPSNAVRRYLLEHHGLVLIHGSAYGPSAEGLLRISFAAGGETLTRGLSLLRAGLSQFASGKLLERQA